MRRLGISFIAAVLATAGCTTVGPNFKAPAAPSTTRYISPGETAPSGADAGSAAPKQTVALGAKVAGQWWTLYRSPDLDAVVRQAMAGSPTLESAKARLMEAREEVAASRGAQYPQLTLDANFSRQKESAATFGLAPGAFPLPPNFNLFQVGPTASYDLDLFGGLRRRVRAAIGPGRLPVRSARRGLPDPDRQYGGSGAPSGGDPRTTEGGQRHRRYRPGEPGPGAQGAPSRTGPRQRRGHR